MATPTALLVSCAPSVDAQDILREITQHDDSVPFSPIAEGVKGFPWQLSNKYYTADILICVAKPCIMGSLTLGDSMEGIIIAMDDKEQSFRKAKSQWSTVKEMNPEVRILACKKFTKTPDVTKQTVLVWCLDNGFELVELEKPEDEDEEEEDGFGVEPYGVKRIVSALHAHTWSNLEMKEDNRSHLLRLQERFGESDDQGNRDNSTADNQTAQNGYTLLRNDEANTDELNSDEPSNDSNREGCARAGTENTDSNREISGNVIVDADVDSRTNDVQSSSGRSEGGRCHGDSEAGEVPGAISGAGQGSGSRGAAGGQTVGKDAAASKPDKIDSVLNEDMKIFEALSNEDPQCESFEQLFSKMAHMKEKASSLEGEDRRRYAEKVAVAFWRAVSGDQDEIDGLDDDDDD